jgi:hypothetical protein
MFLKPKDHVCLKKEEGVAMPFRHVPLSESTCVVDKMRLNNRLVYPSLPLKISTLIVWQ